MHLTDAVYLYAPTLTYQNRKGSEFKSTAMMIVHECKDLSVHSN